jgi:hypothetical protein
MVIRSLQIWHRRRALARAQIRLEALLRRALSAPDYMFRDHQIFSANSLLDELQVRGIITRDERRELAGEWISKYIRACLPLLYRDKNAAAINRLGRLVDGGSLARDSHGASLENGD